MGQRGRPTPQIVLSDDERGALERWARRPTTGQALATLQAPDPRQIAWLGFSHDGGRLAVATTGDHVQLWDLQLIRQQLAALGLDWGGSFDP